MSNISAIPANNMHRQNVVLMFVHRLRRCPNIASMVCVCWDDVGLYSGLVCIYTCLYPLMYSAYVLMYLSAKDYISGYRQV